MTEPRPVLITGATGFIGSHLTTALSSAGRKVHVLVRLESDLTVLAPFLSQIMVHTLDGSMEQLTSIFKSVHPGCVVHLATRFLASHTPQDVTPLIEANVLFGAQLLESMQAAGIRCLVNAGTTWQHYQGQEYDPVNFYAATKQAFEELLRFYVSARDFQAITLELTDTYGPGDRRQKLFALLNKTAQTQEPLPMSPGDQVLDLLYIDDVTRAFTQAVDLLETGRVAGFEKYLLTAVEQKSLKEVVQLYQTLSGVSLPIQWGGRSYREREVMNPWNQGKILPGWKPEIGLTEGIRRILAQKQVTD